MITEDCNYRFLAEHAEDAGNGNGGFLAEGAEFLAEVG